MAQKITGYVKLQIPAGKATPAPPVGPALGQHGVNIAAFTKEFNERTKNDMGMIIPVVITVYADRSFSFITKTPPAAVLIKKECNIESGSGVPGVRHEHDRRHLPVHGRRRRRLSPAFTDRFKQRAARGAAPYSGRIHFRRTTMRRK